jgi:hypothetical protein
MSLQLIGIFVALMHQNTKKGFIICQTGGQNFKFNMPVGSAGHSFYRVGYGTKSAMKPSKLQIMGIDNVKNIYNT